MKSTKIVIIWVVIMALMFLLAIFCNIDDTMLMPTLHS